MNTFTANNISVGDFVKLSKDIPVIDVRSPKEYNTGHIPGSFNIPIFNNEERTIVGTIYKQKNKNDAILKGLDFVGPKLSDFLKQAQKITANNKLIVYCWRGGMRSASMAWLFETAGIQSYIIEGGYKSYRKHGKLNFTKTKKLIVLGGFTGCGKTEILHKIHEQGEQVIGLEKIANHKGSVFGALGQNSQPTNEQFENNLIAEWMKLDLNKPIWVEDESHSIGSNWIPDELYNLMKISPVLKIELDKKTRIKRLVNEYAVFDNKTLESCIQKIEKRLGGQNVKQAIESLEKGDLSNVADITLNYYDKSYNFGLKKREKGSVYKINFKIDNPGKNAKILIEYSKKLYYNT